MKVEGSVALVTGASRGLGRALVQALVEAGASKVYATAREVAVVARHDRVVPLVLDITHEHQLREVAERAQDTTLLINNAGVLRSYDLLTAAQADIDADFRTNALGMLSVVRALLPALSRAPRGATVVNVLSLAALASLPSMGGYSASKAAAYSMTQALRPGLEVRNVRLLAALCGPIDTQMVEHLSLPKAPPAGVARSIVEGIVRDEEEIFPDAMAEQMKAVWASSPKNLERAFSTY
jgi:NAD(P)-dependent dehydrogenase (short-subunit alcohol dehydrogenase family)